MENTALNNSNYYRFYNDFLFYQHRSLMERVEKCKEEEDVNVDVVEDADEKIQHIQKYNDIEQSSEVKSFVVPARADNNESLNDKQQKLQPTSKYYESLNVSDISEDDEVTRSDPNEEEACAEDENEQISLSYQSSSQSETSLTPNLTDLNLKAKNIFNFEEDVIKSAVPTTSIASETLAYQPLSLSLDKQKSQNSNPQHQYQNIYSTNLPTIPNNRFHPYSYSSYLPYPGPNPYLYPHLSNFPMSSRISPWTNFQFNEPLNFHSRQINTTTLPISHNLIQPSESADAFKCDNCKKLFKSKRRLDHHIEKNHNRKLTYKCKFCRSSFKRKSKLLSHQHKSHPESQRNQNQKPSVFHNVELLAQSECNSLEVVVVD